MDNIVILKPIKGSTQYHVYFPEDIDTEKEFTIIFYESYYYNDGCIKEEVGFSVNGLCVINLASPFWNLLIEELGETRDDIDTQIICNLILIILHEELHSMLFLIGHDVTDEESSHYAFDMIEYHLFPDLLSEP